MTPRRPAFAFKGTKRRFLVAPNLPEKGFPTARDFNWATPGEYLGVGTAMCSDPACGCDRSFVGKTTRKSSTIGIVVERDVSELSAHYASATKAWGAAGEDERKDDTALVDLLTLRRFPVGTLVRIHWVRTRGHDRFVITEVKDMPKSPPPRRNPDGLWTKAPRMNPSSAHDLVDIVSLRTGEVLERRLFRYVAEQNAWLFRHDGNKVRIQKHRPVASKPTRRNPLFRKAPSGFVFPEGKPFGRSIVETISTTHGQGWEWHVASMDPSLDRHRAKGWAPTYRAANKASKVIMDRLNKTRAWSKFRVNPSHGLTPHYEPGMFPRAQYYDDVEIPKGFIAQHYGNDAAPLWINPDKRLSLWVNAKRPRDREGSGKRFVLGVTNGDYEPDPEPILETNSMTELLWTIANHRPGV